MAALKGGVAAHGAANNNSASNNARLGAASSSTASVTLRVPVSSGVFLSPPPAASASSPPPARVEKRSILDIRPQMLSIQQCLEIAKQCLEVQRRRAIGGNDQHFLFLVWDRCGGDRERVGRIQQETLEEQLQTFGVAPDTIRDGLPLPRHPSGAAPLSRPSRATGAANAAADGGAPDSEGTVWLTFHDVVALVSFPASVLRMVSQCNTVRDVQAALARQSATTLRANSKSRNMDSNPSSGVCSVVVHSEDAAAMQRQAIALLHFKLLLRRAVAARRRRRKREEEEAANSSLGNPLQRHGTQYLRNGAPMRHAKMRQPTTTTTAAANASRTAMVLPPITSTAAVASSLPSNMPSHHVAPLASRSELDAAGLYGGDGPVALHHDSAHQPWHAARPFASTKVDPMWLSQPLPAVTRRSRGAAADHHFSPLPQTSPLPELRKQLAGLLVSSPAPAGQQEVGRQLAAGKWRSSTSSCGSSSPNGGGGGVVEPLGRRNMSIVLSSEGGDLPGATMHRFSIASRRPVPSRDFSSQVSASDICRDLGIPEKAQRSLGLMTKPQRRGGSKKTGR